MTEDMRQLVKAMEEAIENDSTPRTNYTILVGTVRGKRGNLFEMDRCDVSMLDTGGLLTDMFCKAFYEALGNHLSKNKDLHGNDAVNALSIIALTPPKGFKGGVLMNQDGVVIESRSDEGTMTFDSGKDRVPALMAVFEGLKVKLGLGKKKK